MLAISLLLQALFALSTQTSVIASHPPRFQGSGWATTCWQGTGGFAVDCESTKRVRSLALHLSASDEQLVISIDAGACSPTPFFIFRDRLFLISKRQRQKFVMGVFATMAAELHGKCKSSAALDPTTFGAPPDIALADEHDLGWKRNR